MDQRSLIRFDLSEFADAENVEKSTLSVYSVAQPRPGDAKIYVHRVARAWNEHEANWFEASDGVPWTDEGGDIEGAFAEYQTTTEIEIWNSVDITSYVKDAIENPDGNFGIMLYMEVTMLTVEYASSENYSE